MTQEISKDPYVDWKGWSESEFARCGRSPGRYFSWHLKQCGISKPGARILEIGFGNGEFLGFAAQQGHQVTGLEVSEELVARARLHHFTAATSLSELPRSEEFDLIVAFDVLEHLNHSELESLLNNLLYRLAPNGKMLFRVPNGDSPFGRRHQHGDITHITTFALSKFRQLAKTCGLEVMRTGEAPWYAQQIGGRTLRNALRAALRWCITSTVCFAFNWEDTDLSPNLIVVLHRTQENISQK